MNYVDARNKQLSDQTRSVIIASTLAPLQHRLAASLPSPTSPVIDFRALADHR